MLPQATLLTSVQKVQKVTSVEPVTLPAPGAAAAPSTPPKSAAPSTPPKSGGKQQLEVSPGRMTQQGMVEIHLRSASALKPSGPDGSADPVSAEESIDNPNHPRRPLSAPPRRLSHAPAAVCPRPPVPCHD